MKELLYVVVERELPDRPDTWCVTNDYRPTDPTAKVLGRIEVDFDKEDPSYIMTFKLIEVADLDCAQFIVRFMDGGDSQEILDHRFRKLMPHVGLSVS
jgi:hypothetical protein